MLGCESLVILLQIDCGDKLQRDIMYKLPLETCVSPESSEGMLRVLGCDAM